MNKLDPHFTTVAVLQGGWSAEREVSMATGEACSGALRRAGFTVVPIDVKADRIFPILADLKPEVVFNGLHGKWGEDGSAAALLETLKIPYTHSGVLASALAMNKEKSKILFKEAGIPVAEGKIVELKEAAMQHAMPFPYVVKPIAEGSSVGVHIITREHNSPPGFLLDQQEIFGSHVMVEQFIPGKELSCAVMGDVALGVIEIVPSIGFFDYQAKYTDGGAKHSMPADIPVEVYRKCQAYALKAHQALGCRGVSRSDFRFDDRSTASGEPIILEVNTQPGMTAQSLVPEIAAHAGHSFDELVVWMVNDASLNR